jgi:hypothetical protein
MPINRDEAMAQMQEPKTHASQELLAMLEEPLLYDENHRITLPVRGETKEHRMVEKQLSDLTRLHTIRIHDKVFNF